MDFVKKHIDWVPVIIIIVIFGGSLPFKFTGAPITDHIFDVVGQFLGLDFFRTTGGYIIGMAELTAIILLLMPKTRGLGGLLTTGVMTGAIIFHLFSPLGIAFEYTETDGSVGYEDGSLFYSAVVAFLSGLYLAIKNKDQILGLLGQSDE